VIDIQNDENLEILADRLSDPENSMAVELLKTASISDSFEDLIDEAFADRENRKFPIYSPDMAVMSALYIQAQDDVPELVKEACQKALDDWGIEGISVDIKKEASSPDIEIEYLLPSREKLPVVDKETLEKSASALNGVIGSLPIVERIEAANKLYKIATETYGYKKDDLSEEVLRYSMSVPCDLNKLASSVSDRYAETHNDEYRNFIKKIAMLKDEIGGSVSYDKELNNGIGYELFSLDKEAGVENIFDAIYDTFNSPYLENEELGKTAAPVTPTINIGGYDISEDKILSMSAPEIDSIAPGLSSEIFEDGEPSLDKLASVAEDLSYEARINLGRILSEA